MSLRLLPFVGLLAAVAGPACSGKGGTGPVPGATEPDDLRDLPSDAAAVIRFDFRGPEAEALRAAVAASSEGRIGCLVEMLPSIERATVALVPRERELAAAMVIQGAVDEERVQRCGEALARTLALRPPPEGSSPAVVPLENAAGGSRRYFVALDSEADRSPGGLRGPLAAALAAVSDEPVAVAVTGGETLRALSAHAATYLPLSSMSTAADRIDWIAYGLRPRAGGGVAARASVRLTDAGAATALARQIRDVGRVIALPGDDSAWAPMRDRIVGLEARVTGDGRSVEASAVLSADGLRGLLM